MEPDNFAAYKNPKKPLLEDVINGQCFMFQYNWYFKLDCRYYNLDNFNEVVFAEKAILDHIGGFLTHSSLAS